MAGWAKIGAGIHEQLPIEDYLGEAARRAVWRAFSPHLRRLNKS